MQQHVNVTTIQHHPVETTEPSNGRGCHSYNGQSSIVLGALQIVIGILCFAFNSGAIALSASHGAVGHGFWCGICFIIAGVLGVAAGQKKTNSLIVAFMVVSIINAVLCIFLLSFSASGVTADNRQNCFFGLCFNTEDTVPSHVRHSRVAMNGILVALSLFEVIVAIWSSAICCSAVCCGNTNTGGVILAPHAVHYVNQPNQPHVMIISPNGQMIGQPVGAQPMGPQLMGPQPMGPQLMGPQPIGQPMGPPVQYYPQSAYNTGPQPQTMLPAMSAPPAYDYPGMTATGSNDNRPVPQAPPMQTKQGF